MKTIYNEDKIIAFLNREQIKSIQFNNKEKLEEYFKKLFIKLNDKYDIEFNGYYNIDIYVDNNYGMIIEIMNEDMDYYNYFNQVDMKINIIESSFLYEIKYEFLNKDILENTLCYKYLDKIYLKLKENINNIILSRLLEFSNVIYGKQVDKILNISKKVNI